MFYNSLHVQYLFPREHFKAKLFQPSKCWELLIYFASNMMGEAIEIKQICNKIFLTKLNKTIFLLLKFLTFLVIC